MREEGILPIVDTLHHLLKIIIGNQNDARIKLYSFTEYCVGRLQNTTLRIFSVKGVPLPHPLPQYPLNGKFCCQKKISGIGGYPPPPLTENCPKKWSKKGRNYSLGTKNTYVHVFLRFFSLRNWWVPPRKKSDK